MIQLYLNGMFYTGALYWVAYLLAKPPYPPRTLFLGFLKAMLLWPVFILLVIVSFINAARKEL